MRKLSIEKMETEKDIKKLDKFVGASFERNEETDEMFNRLDETTPNSLGGWTRLICF
ncbi:hypothetical protein UAY_00513 [Enterococcus moraviensis ATCC BAA-383]|uniref:Uncharacterized protein n=1 Tax=Enterococcus moraviensis ATCC BAA-383 TaxID=1158609 RepID=R2TIV2_9ENTE|nr:hypothetical protein [Enterococcus moraviensis]EOI05039.1 hypothetical protein UAY_00513 [Enterococcus moraviensis ATCC BAA-383]EOT63822.1 hypothetical protein I586_03255 [Enterococcus moraviensis ATCC BAA-383]OJG67046.1 hypothetical protein RV09_GL002955 [Enterococcus moraviensis]